MNRTAIIALVVLTACGCAAPRAENGFGEVHHLAAARLGARIHWNSATEADAQIDRQIDSMLMGELSADAAVQIALLKNPRLQAHYEELGVAQADLVQAGLLKNPVFDGFVRWPDDGSGPNVELSVAADFLDVLFVGARRRIAGAELERTKLQVADQVLELAAQVREAFYESQASQQMLELRRTVVTAEEAAAQTAQRLHAAGNINQLDADRESALAEQAKLEVVEAQAEAAQSRERVATLMGIAGSANDWKIGTRLADVPGGHADPRDLQRAALKNRLDLQAAAAEVRALQESLGLSRRTSFVSEAEVGVNTERGPDGQRVTGPQLRVPIPLFDFGQARVSAAKHRLRAAQQRYQSLRQQAVSEVALAAQRMNAAEQRFAHYRDVILPLRHRIVEQSQLHYNGMLLGIFELLAAKQNEIEAGAQYVAAQRDFWIAQAQLERAVGGRLRPDAAASATKPTASPASSMPASSMPAMEHSGHQH